MMDGPLEGLQVPIPAGGRQCTFVQMQPCICCDEVEQVEVTYIIDRVHDLNTFEMIVKQGDEQDE